MDINNLVVMGEVGSPVFVVFPILSSDAIPCECPVYLTVNCLFLVCHSWASVSRNLGRYEGLCHGYHNIVHVCNEDKFDTMASLTPVVLILEPRYSSCLSSYLTLAN